MTAKIGSKHIAQHRGKKEREEIHKMNVAREAVKIAEGARQVPQPAEGSASAGRGRVIVA